MISAIVDTNVLVQSTMSTRGSASVRTLDAYYAGSFQLICSNDTLDELLTVMAHPVIRKRHGMSDDEIITFVDSLLPGAIHYRGMRPVPPSVTRDATDTSFLSLAVESRANFLVTNDRRHLLRLKRYEQTRIVTPAVFLRELP